MANLSNELNQIKNAVYGKDVRDSIHDGIDKINKDSELAKTVANQAKYEVESIQEQVNQLVVEGDSSIEAAQARVGSDNTAHSTLKARLDAENTAVTQHLDRLDAENTVVTQHLDRLDAENTAVIQELDRLDDAVTQQLNQITDIPIPNKILKLDDNGELNFLALPTLSKNIYARKSDGYGVGIFHSIYDVPFNIILIAYDKTNALNHLIATGYKENSASRAGLNVISNNVLSLGAYNEQGTQVILGAVPSNVLTTAIIIGGAPI